MSTTFPKSRKRGYDVDEVEEFLEEARQAYSADRSDNVVVNSATIRKTAFSLKRGGYSVPHVDAALERLEDAFAVREQARAVQANGDDAWYQQARLTAQEVLDRLARPRGHRFARAGFLVAGYRRTDVDALVDLVSAHLESGAPLEIGVIRSAAFRPQRGGYREAQVDLVLDSVIDVMLAVD